MSFRSTAKAQSQEYTNALLLLSPENLRQACEWAQSSNDHLKQFHQQVQKAAKVIQREAPIPVVVPPPSTDRSAARPVGKSVVRRPTQRPPLLRQESKGPPKAALNFLAKLNHTNNKTDGRKRKVDEVVAAESEEAPEEEEDEASSSGEEEEEVEEEEEIRPVSKRARLKQETVEKQKKEAAEKDKKEAAEKEKEEAAEKEKEELSEKVEKPKKDKSDKAKSEGTAEPRGRPRRGQEAAEKSERPRRGQESTDKNERPRRGQESADKNERPRRGTRSG